MLTAFTTEPILSAEAVKTLEQSFLHTSFDPDVLVKKAGKALAKEVVKCWPRARRVTIFCGSGNNGADGYSAAIHLHEQGITPVLVPLMLKRKGTASMEQMRAQCEALGLTVIENPHHALHEADVVIDAVLGNGQRATELPMFLQTSLLAIKNCGLPVLAVDIPTGIIASSGEVLPHAVAASRTMAFIAARMAHRSGDAAAFCGDVSVETLGLNVANAPQDAICLVKQKQALFPPRPVNSHKGRQGHLLVIGGNHGMGGAALLAAEAALRSGAGKVTVLTRPEHVTAFLARTPELMVRGITKTPSIKQWLISADAVVLGPGLGNDAWAKNLWRQTIESDLPLLCDADAITLWKLLSPKVRQAPTVFTPHPGEAARLLACSAKQVQHSRLQSLQALMNKLEATIVLKGNGTLISSLDSVPLLLNCGNPGMAIGGMGDILSGIVGALLAQQYEPDRAACLGAWWHGRAADRVAEKRGQIGLLPTDVIAALSESHAL